MALTNEKKAAREQARQAKWAFQRGGIPNNSRYALYDTRRSVVIQFAFSNVSRLTRQLIARYADTFEHYRYTGDLLEKSVFSAGGFN